MTKISLTLEAIDKTNERLSVAPDFAVLHSIKGQLKFILSSFREGRIPNDADKEKITLGVLAVREFESNDPEYADLLEKISYLYKHPEINEI